MFPRGDNYGTVPINFNFNYFSQSFSQLTINTNGFIIFGTISPSPGNWISALNYDLDTSTSGGIYYQNLNSQSSDFNSIRSDLNRLNASFVPTNLFRITYDNVPNYGSSSYFVSFQIILASDASNSYVLLKYTSCFASGYLTHVPALYYLSANGEYMSSQISFFPCTETNVNQGGTWVFDVSSSNSQFFFIDFKLITVFFVLASVTSFD